MLALIIVAIACCGVLFIIDVMGVTLGDGEEKVVFGGHGIVLGLAIVTLSLVLANGSW